MAMVDVDTAGPSTMMEYTSNKWRVMCKFVFPGCLVDQMELHTKS